MTKEKGTRFKKLASFNCDPLLWAEFIEKCQKKGTTATATLNRFIELYLAGELENLDAFSGKAYDEQFNERVKAYVNDYLEKYLPSEIEKYLAANYLSKNFRPPTPSKKSQSNKEIWFIQERAKHLGFKLNANQLLMVEMFASDAYKEQYGEPPKRQLFRGVQAIAFPNEAIEILDATIKRFTS